MELQRAIDKPRIGMHMTPVLALIHAENYARLSSMVKGAALIHQHVYLEKYNDLTDAQKAIRKFLTAPLDKSH